MLTLLKEIYCCIFNQSHAVDLFFYFIFYGNILCQNPLENVNLLIPIKVVAMEILCQ